MARPDMDRNEAFSIIEKFSIPIVEISLELTHPRHKGQHSNAVSAPSICDLLGDGALSPGCWVGRVVGGWAGACPDREHLHVQWTMPYFNVSFLSPNTGSKVVV